MKFDNVLVVGGSGFIGRGALERLVAGRQAVINLVGILHGDFHRLHVELPQAIVNACRAAGVKRVLHMSALGAARDAPSEYLRSKALGEEAVLAATDLEATVFRPSVVFGPEDRFLNLFAQLTRFLPALALACPGAQFQPVYVGDVARFMAASLDETESLGKRYDLGGPRRYTLRELLDYVCTVTGRRRLVIGLPYRLSLLQAWLLEHLPGPLMTRDNVRSMQVPNICDNAAAVPAGLMPQALEAIAPSYLAPRSVSPSQNAGLGPRERYPQLRWRARR